MLDGNKRLGTHVMLVFLALNGYELEYSQKGLSDTILALAAGEVRVDGLLQWIIEHQKQNMENIVCWIVKPFALAGNAKNLCKRICKIVAE